MDGRARQHAASLIIPVYNSASTLAVLRSQIVEVMELAGRPFHVVFVDDASTDGSADELRGLALLDPRVCVLHHARNGGQAAAIRTGIAHASDPILLTLDDDLSHRPEDVPHLLECLLSAGDERALVIGVSAGWPRFSWRGVASITANVLCNAFLKNPLPLRATTFCAFHRTLGGTLVHPASRRDASWLVPLLQSAERTITMPVAIKASGLKHSRYGMKALWTLFRSRAHSFIPRRLLMVSGLSVIVALLATAIVARGGEGGIWYALVVLDSIAIALAVTIAIFTCVTIADRQASASDVDPPATSFPSRKTTNED